MPLADPDSAANLSRLPVERIEAVRHIDDPESGFLLLSGPRTAIISNAERTQTNIRWFSHDELSAIGALPRSGILFLGMTPSKAARFAINVSENEAEAYDQHISPLVDIRSLVTQGVIQQQALNLIATARALAEWTDASAYCGRCGHRTEMLESGWKRSCSQCATHIFPRVDPVVIMLITDRANRCLLAHEPRFPENMLSTLAGFIEPGEDIITAVRRETYEEVGIRLKEVSITGSQGWPFPHSLMIGCTAEAEATELTIDTTEISHANWYDREEVKAMLAGQHPQGLFVPSGHAIAHKLIRQWAHST